MKNLLKNFTGLGLALVALLAFVPSALAQSGFDAFGNLRTLIVQSPTNLSTGTTVSWTNDTHGFQGVAILTLIAQTNGIAGGGVTTATIEGSTDTNTFAAITYARATISSVNVTNTALAGTYFPDVYFLPGTTTTPTAATAGWATPYLLPAPFTNTAAITMPIGGIAQIGYNVGDAPRYLRITWTATAGAITNTMVSAVLTARRSFGYP